MAGVFRSPSSVFYGWRLVGVAVFMLTLLSLTVFQGLGIFLVALQSHFGWSRTAISGAFSLLRVEGAALGPLEGFLVDRFGVRRMTAIGVVIMATGFILLSGVQNLWQFYLTFCLIAVGSGVGGWMAMVTLVNNWFIRRRSIAMATAMSGVHFGGFLVPALAFGIESHGFRWTTFGIGVVLLATVPPVTRMIRNRPEEYGLQPDGGPVRSPSPRTSAATPTPGTGDEADLTVRQALRTPAFWTITVAHLSSSVSIVTLAVHLAPRLTDMGLSLGDAGLVVLTYTAIAIPSQFASGFFADRLPKPLVTFAFLIIQAVSILIIAVADNVYIVFLFAVLFGIGFGGRIPLLTAIRGEYFGRKAFATLMGLSMLPNNLVMIGAPILAAYVFDTTGSYFRPFAALAAFGFIGAIPILFARKPTVEGGSGRRATGQSPG